MPRFRRTGALGSFSAEHILDAVQETLEDVVGQGAFALQSLQGVLALVGAGLAVQLHQTPLGRLFVPIGLFCEKNFVQVG